ncbi:MAG: hypothetical protein HY391_01620 [Deltaproteobacteria bacterium]|nr:hypothetical protein [Deltaproteobacteria bacterium]
MKRVLFGFFLFAFLASAQATSQDYKAQVEEIVGFSIADETLGNPQFAELQALIFELKYVDLGDALQSKLEKLINLTLELYPDVDLAAASELSLYRMGDLLYVEARPGSYDTRRFIFNDKELIDWAYSWYDEEEEKIDFLNDRMDRNIIYCAGQKIADLDWALSQGYRVLKDYYYVPNSREIHSLTFLQEDGAFKEIFPYVRENTPGNFRERVQAAYVNGTNYFVYDLDSDMIRYSRLRLAVASFLD